MVIKEIDAKSVLTKSNLPVSIERRLEAMRKLHNAGIRTTCFISPIFPGITDVPAIIDCVKEQCNLVWLENLNLRGSYKSVIMNYIKEKYPGLLSLYQEIRKEGGKNNCLNCRKSRPSAESSSHSLLDKPSCL